MNLIFAVFGFWLLSVAFVVMVDVIYSETHLTPTGRHRGEPKRRRLRITQ